MNKILYLLNLIFASIIIAVYAISSNAAPPPPTPDKDEKETIQQAVLDAIQSQREYVLAYLVNDIRVVDVQISKDGSWGIAYLEMVDPNSGDVIPNEPGIAISRREDSEWRVTLPGDLDWLLQIRSAPEDLLSDDVKDVYVEMNTTAAASTSVTYGGYLLPWEAGKTVYLSQSTGHDQYIPSGSAHYSFDFYISKTMYRLHASKAGTIWRVRWDVPNGDDSDMGNYLVIKDITTNPVTYQLYLHLAQDSIPPALRTFGAYVAQGQFIGLADDTGQSTGHHLHFHVHTNPISYWGTSVDITFDDVDINGGRPRRESDKPYCTRPDDVCDKFRTSYISGNTVHGDITPPTGDILKPSTGITVTASEVHVEGWVNDEGSGLDRANLIAYYDDAWHEVGGEISTPAFAMDWDMCINEVPNGPVSIALRAWDNAGNPSQGFPGLTHLIKDYSCDPLPPACNPRSDQVALFSDRDYWGKCEILGLGEHPDISALLEINDNDVESILVGENVLASLYDNTNFNGRSITLESNDSNLDDNSIGNNTLSSLKVTQLSTPPQAPQELIAPMNGEQFAEGDSISIAWRDSGGGIQYRVSIDGPTGETLSPWLANQFWHLDNLLLPQGTYSWKVRARNCTDAACRSSWSQTATFTITPSLPSLPSVTAPFSDDVEGGTGNWTYTGLWNRLSNADRSHSPSHSWYYGKPLEHSYNTGYPNSGDLTLRPVFIPDSGYILRFWYRYETEEAGKNWDQRWIQISTDGDTFKNVLQLNDDVPNYWLQAIIDLSMYAGQTIQIRFYFTTLDEQQNTNEGWYVDDIEILVVTLPTCNDSDDSPSGARLLTFDQTRSGKMCPTGDVDYYKFIGKAGDRIVLDVDTPNTDPIEDLDLILFLLDSDGSSVLEIHDDEIYGAQLDPHLGYLLTRSGIYYVRARLWSHPSAGGEDYKYQITLSKDNQKPSGNFSDPSNGIYLPDTPQLSLVVDANDSESGISELQFLYHSGDWLNSGWTAVGIDQDGSDGWGITFDTTAISEQKDIAFFANIYDWSGNWTGAGVWELGIDRTPPVTSLADLEVEQGSTAILLEWTGDDNLSGMFEYELQNQADSGSWSYIEPNPSGSDYQAWFIGQTSTEYGFRMRGIDIAGNQEEFPSAAETITSIPDAEDLCSSPDTWDTNSDDNSPQNAVAINLDETSKVHNFCNPLAEDRLSDEDWVKFSVELGETYYMLSRSRADMTASILELYASDGSTLITDTKSDRFGVSSEILWKADREDQVYLRIRHIDGRVAGNIVSYRLVINKIMKMFLPLVNH
jgi:hypothetical protein